MKHAWSLVGQLRTDRMNLQTDRNVFQAKASLTATWPWVSWERFPGCFEGRHQDLSIHVVNSSVDRGSHVDGVVDVQDTVETVVGMDLMVSGRIKRVQDSRL